MFSKRHSKPVITGDQTLHINVVETRNLAILRKSKKLNPYCTLAVSGGGGVSKTQVQKSGKWNEIMSLVCNKSSNLLVAVWNKDGLWRDDFLGQVTINVSDVEKKGGMCEWFGLEHRPKKPKEPISGEIYLRLSLKGVDDVKADKVAPKAAPTTPTPTPISRPVVVATPDSGSDSSLSESDSDSDSEDKKEPPTLTPVVPAVVTPPPPSDGGSDQQVDTTKENDGVKPTTTTPQGGDAGGGAKGSDDTSGEKESGKRVLKGDETTPAVAVSKKTIDAIIEELQEVYSDPCSCVKKLTWDKEGKILSINLGTEDRKTLRLTMIIGESYPHQRPVTILEDNNDNFDENVVEGFVERINEYSNSKTKTLVDIMTFVASQFDKYLNRSMMKKSLLMSKKIEKGGKVNLGISQALGQGWRTASTKIDVDDDGDGDEYDEDDYLSDDDMDYDWDVDQQEETLLAKHVKQVQIVFGGESAKLWKELNTVRLFVDARFMDATSAEAMGVIREEPIVVVMQIADNYLESDAPPKIEVKQPKNARFGLEFQLTEIARKFMRENWPRRKMGVTLPATSHSREKDRMEARTNDIKHLLKEGFDQLAAANALEECGGQLDKALNMLIKNGGNIDAADVASSEDTRHNFIAWTMTYMLSRVRNCTGYCLICDKKLEGGGIKPVVCTDDQCTWRTEELGLGILVTNELARDSDVVDLLISMLVSASNSSRKDLICEPFPPDFKERDRKDFNSMESALNKIPPVDQMLAYLENEKDLRAFLESKEQTLYRLIRWILSTNRAYIKALEPSKHVKQMNTPYQYAMLSSPPERNAKFNALREQYGSFFAFHGSALENWHAIMRTGLRNLSNTKLMTTGAAYGSGIYLSPHTSTSKDYARFGKGWLKSKYGSNDMTCMAICEVIQHPCLHGQPNPHYVVPDEDMVCTRIFCFFTSSNDIPSSVDLPSLKAYLYSLQGYQPGKK